MLKVSVPGLNINLSLSHLDLESKLFTVKFSVGDLDPEPDLDPQDLHIVGLLRSGSGSRSFPFLINGLSGLK
jgi:hypothetical protein